MSVVKKKTGCKGTLLVSPRKTSVLNKTNHACSVITSESILVKSEKQKLKAKLADPLQITTTVRSMYNTFESNLVINNGLSYDDISNTLKTFDQQQDCFSKIRQKIVPQDKRNLISFENFSGLYSVTNDGYPFLQHDNFEQEDRMIIFFPTER